MQGVRARYHVVLPPIISVVPFPGRPITFSKILCTAVTKMITELIRFEPEICVCNGN